MRINPLLWLHWRISGSSRTNVIVVGVYAIVVIFFSILSFYIAAANALPGDRSQDFAQVNSVWLIIMTGAQCIFLLLIAPSAVRRAVQRDFDSGMMESHRLTPLSNLSLVLGYMIGGPIQALLLYLVSLVFGCYFAAMYGGSPGLGGVLGVLGTLGAWCFAQNSLLVIAAMITSAVLLSALATRGKANIAGALMLVCVLGGWAAILFVPGLALVLGVFSGDKLYQLLTTAKLRGGSAVFAQAIVFQIAFCLIFLAASCRKLRRPDYPLFSLPLSLLLAGTWGAALIAGLVAAADSSWSINMNAAETHFAQLISSILAFAAVCYFALWAVAMDRSRHDHIPKASKPNIWSSGRVAWLMPAAMAALTFLFAFLAYKQTPMNGTPTKMWLGLSHWQYWTAVGPALLLSFWTDFNLIVFLLRWVKRPLILLVVALGLLKGAPLLCEQVIQFLVEGIADQKWSWHGSVSCISPIGMLIYATDGNWAWAGLVPQALLAGIATALGRTASRRAVHPAAAQVG